MAIDLKGIDVLIALMDYPEKFKRLSVYFV